MKDEKKEMALAKQVEGMSLESMASHLQKSGYFRDINDPSKAIVKIMAGREVGIPPIAAMMGLYVVEGKVTYSATMVGALIKRAGYKYTVEWKDGACVLNFRDKDGLNLGTSSFSMADAKAAGLDGKHNWKTYPKAMMFARALSQGGRWFCPEVFAGGCYTPEELNPNAAVTEEGEVIDTTATPTPPADPLGEVRAKMVDAFGKQGVDKATLENFCGCHIEELTEENLTKLKDVFREVRKGKTLEQIAQGEKPAEPTDPDDLDSGTRTDEAPPPPQKSKWARMSDKELEAHVNRVGGKPGMTARTAEAIDAAGSKWEGMSQREKHEYLAEAYTNKEATK